MTRRDLILFVRQIERHGGRATEWTCNVPLITFAQHFLIMYKYDKYDNEKNNDNEAQFREMYQDLKEIVDVIPPDVIDKILNGEEVAMPSHKKCNMCKENHRYISKKNKEYTYCHDCLKEYTRENKKKNYKPHVKVKVTICPECKVREKEFTKRGKTLGYCRECCRVKTAIRHQKRMVFNG